MDYEQKYKEALERAKKELQMCSSTDCDAARQIFRFFPELKKHKQIYIFVDLGLPSGTLWAECNLGADSPEEAGDYYRFGEIVPHTEDSPEYVYDNIDGDIASSNRDAVTARLGKGYHIPTFEQIKELLDNCKWKWTAIGGVNGIKVTGPNGNSIFFPAAGYRDNSSGALYVVGSYGFYWSSSPYNTYGGRSLDFDSGYWNWYSYNRAVGFPIRPVKNW